MAFDLSNYEDVNARIGRFRAEFPMGRLEAHIDHIDFENGRILVRALAFRTDDPNEMPAAIDYAFEFRATHGVNRDFWVENAVTSAYGRAIGALSPSNARPTRQDMEKAETLHAAPVDHYQPPNVKTAAQSISELKQVLGAKVMSEPPKCQHGHRLKKSGTAKTGRPYLGWACPEKRKADQCEMIWWRQTPDGDDWLSPDDYQDYLNERGRNLDPKSEREPVPDALLSPTERKARHRENES
jgi:hypothetical protein